MAIKTTTVIIDDIDGTEDATPVTFAFDGKSYEIDLSKENKAKLAEALKPYIKAGRAVSNKPSRGGRKDLAAIRLWANQNGYSVSPKGRVPVDVVEAYEAANK